MIVHLIPARQAFVDLLNWRRRDQILTLVYNYSSFFFLRPPPFIFKQVFPPINSQLISCSCQTQVFPWSPGDLAPKKADGIVLPLQSAGDSTSVSSIYASHSLEKASGWQLSWAEMSQGSSVTLMWATAWLSPDL